ncbi:MULTISPECIES: acyl-CoA carboxylase subunit epsilon [unclassified Arthrobacter]|uniref:acyl-CoA carboxylase subunit epsilon n=1 Tax=unclassified Arthrobacter TaxID=235627 RepID=UPI00298F09EA|nr:acyl-CoA carboxylase subunit epsilon [Arthrobacter sp. AET 35A]
MTITPIRPGHSAADDDAVAPADAVFSVVRGTPTAEELAALTAVVVALSSDSPEPDAGTPHRTWVRRNQLRLAPLPGPGSWKRSGR